MSLALRGLCWGSQELYYRVLNVPGAPVLFSGWGIGMEMVLGQWRRRLLFIENFLDQAAQIMCWLTLRFQHNPSQSAGGYTLEAEAYSITGARWSGSHDCSRQSNPSTPSP